MTTHSKTQYELRPLEMAALKAVAAADAPAADRATFIVKIALSLGLWAASEQIDPTGLAIPEEQWKDVATLLRDLDGQPLDGTNHALTWMNVGPSAYSPEDAS